MGDLSKFFSREECECKCQCGLMNIDPELLRVMDELRVLVGHGLTPSSGSRCGKNNSVHLTGMAVDLKTPGSIQRWELLNAISLHNEISLRSDLHIIARIGIGRSFIHIDLDDTKPQNVILVY